MDKDHNLEEVIHESFYARKTINCALGVSTKLNTDMVLQEVLSLLVLEIPVTCYLLQQ